MFKLLLLAGVICSASAFLDSLLMFVDNNCTVNEFACRNGKCILNSKHCDGSVDCLDGSDEDDCDMVLCKEPKYFRCKNKRCVHASFVCDGENDCEDFSDETACENFSKASLSPNSTCETGFWQCSDKLCIPNDWVCNDESDCLDGSDETIGCTSKIECDGFKCKNGHCIPSEWECDGRADCADHSDEADCENHIDPKLCTWDAHKFLCSNNKTCIDLKQVCDGQVQCPDKSDESALCKTVNNSCATHGCTHDCVQFPTGPKCLCPQGYHNIDEKHCQDINECEIFDICDQKCVNKPGSYECKCEHKYILQDDKKTCKVVGTEAMMVFSSKTEIRGFMLTSEIYFPIAKNLKQVVGVAYDGSHVYWTDILSEHESIVRSNEDGSERELLVTSGLELPEDLAIDWITENIYFTDAEKQHIGVCSNNGLHCTVLVNKDIRKPRGIVLNVDDGEMYWTDWGKPAEIAVSNMDGSEDREFVSSDLHWPNGLTLDYPNRRLYWTDARRMTLESIRLDGTDRRIILEGIVKHPYAIAVFENRLYWSDWGTHSIQSCDKFTGKNHTTIVKENREFIYGLSIFHSAMRIRSENPCALAFCSDICLLSGATKYTCACPQNKELMVDGHTCKNVGKKEMLVVGTKSLLVHVEHQALGKHDITALPNVVKNVGALAFNSVTNTLYISDLDVRKIIALNLHDGSSKPLAVQGIRKVIAMDFDHLTNTLYWCDELKATVEVLNLNTMSQSVLLHDMNGEVAESLALVPEEGIMFVAFRDQSMRKSHIDRFFMDGSGRSHVVENGLQGPIALHFDEDLYRVFWADAGTGNLESTSVEGEDRHGFRALASRPIGLTSLRNDVFWVNERSRRIYWAQKTATKSYNKKITLDIPSDTEHLYIISVYPKKQQPSACQFNNGNCSHLCLAAHKSTVCACPVGMQLDATNRTCFTRTECDSMKEFRCTSTNTCIIKSLKCNGHPDCKSGEDEADCSKVDKCSLGQFTCDDGQCIRDVQVCDYHYDCRDKSDEQKCDEKHKKERCPSAHFRCGDGKCIADRFVCDGLKDCTDDSDEKGCSSSTCDGNSFRCLSGACIPNTWECDHEYDCDDLSDEHANCKYDACSSEFFTCKNKRCIDRKLQCDNRDDCGDNSDEIDCTDQFLAKLGNCQAEEFACTSNTSICLHNSAKCNGTSECPHHEDEKDCSNCNVDEFSCDNKRCIPTQWLCDKQNDCGDNSDEKTELCNGEHLNTTLTMSTSCQNGFRCKTGACIDTKLVCNGNHDCYDGSDEDGVCKTACASGHNPCSQECIKTPVGPRCECRLGYQLSGDGHSCIDKNECEVQPAICSQLCVNEDGAFKCDCYNGFILRADRKSCKAEGVPLAITFVSDNQLREQDQQTNSLRIIHSENTPRITGLDIDVNNSLIYFSIEESATLERLNRKTKVHDYLKHIGKPQKIAVDWSTSNIYYVNADSGAKFIGVCNFDDKACGKLINIDLHRQVTSLAVDSVNRVLFYAVASWWVFNAPTYVIYRTNLDGSGRVELVKHSDGAVAGLAFDYNRRKLYYSDHHSGSISVVNYDGKVKMVLYGNLTRPSELKFFENHLYYAMNGGYVGKCKLYGSDHGCTTFKLASFDSGLFALVQQSLQPKMLDVCKMHACSYLCVAGSAGYKCLCPGGAIVGAEEKCEASERESLNDGHQVQFHVVKAEEKTKSGTWSIVTAILVTVSFVAVGALVYWIARRRNHGKLNISIKFNNPSYGQQCDDLEKPILQPGQHEYSNPVVRFNDELDCEAKSLIDA